MGTITVSTQISAPIEKVFEVFTDLDTKAEEIESIVSIEKLTEGPFGEGTRFRETRLMFKKEAVEEMWITNFNAPNSFSTNAESHGSKYTTLFSFDSNDGGTKVTWDFTSTPQKLGAKIMAPIFNVMMTRMMKKFMRQDLEALGSACEKQS